MNQKYYFVKLRKILLKFSYLQFTGACKDNWECRPSDMYVCKNGYCVEKGMK